MDKFSFLIIIVFFLVFPSSINAQVVINELLPDSVDGSDWVELYSNVDTDISGWIISDSTSEIVTIPQDTLIGPLHGYYRVFEVSNRLNNDGDSVVLKDIVFDNTVDEFSYDRNPGNNVSIGRYPDGQEWKHCVPTIGLSNTDCQEIVSSSNTTFTATYKIKDAVDDNGELISSVKIYVDNVYIHHFTPEDITFCENCTCDDYVGCGFGTHDVKLEKSGYEDWTQTITINSGDYTEASPVLKKIVVLSDTESPTSTPKPTPPTPTPTGNEFKVSLPLSRTPTPENKEEDSSEGESSLEVLGVQQVNDKEKDKETSETDQNNQKLSPSVILFILAGIVFIGLAVYLFYKQKKSETVSKNETKENIKNN